MCVFVAFVFFVNPINEFFYYYHWRGKSELWNEGQDEEVIGKNYSNLRNSLMKEKLKTTFVH
jgi:hypothetical protein